MASEEASLPNPKRSLEIPTSLSAEFVPVDFDDLATAEYLPIADLLRNEQAPVKFWVRLIEEIWRLGKWTLALEIGEMGVMAFDARQGGNVKEVIPLLCMLSTYHLALARRAPKKVLSQPRSAPLKRHTLPEHPEAMHPEAKPFTKDHYWGQAETYLKRAESLNPKDKVVVDTKAAFCAAVGRVEEAHRLFESILSQEPTHLYALAYRAKHNFMRKAYQASLKGYQTILSLCPTFLPDPRIGIGMCLEATGEREKAQRAWNRSIAINPTASALFLLGLSQLNAARDPSSSLSSTASLEEQAAKQHSFSEAYQSISAAFKLDNTIASVCVVLGQHFSLKGNFDAAIKLIERGVQFADTRIILSECHLALARVLHSRGDLQGADAAYLLSRQAFPDQLLARLAHAQSLIRSEEFPAAANEFETILRSNPNVIEALVSLASIHTYGYFTSHPDAGEATAGDRRIARENYERVMRILSSHGSAAVASGSRGSGQSERIAEQERDWQMFVEIAQLCASDPSLDPPLKAYSDAFKIFSALDESTQASLGADGTRVGKNVSSLLLNNIGVLEYHKGFFDSAKGRFLDALEEMSKKVASGIEPDLVHDAVVTGLMYNFGVVHEALGDREVAKSTYESILEKHPEFVDAKAHLALLALKSGDHQEKELAHSLLKEALTSQPKNPELRALYVYFLCETGATKNAQDFATGTLRDLNRYDVYSNCALGALSYTRGRENKDLSKAGLKEQQLRFQRAGEFFEQAIKVDPHCAFAAQGLAIAIAEGRLGTGIADAAIVENPKVTEVVERAKNARDALTILHKVKDSINSGSVYINIGHCHFLRDEWERAIESYETASKRYYGEKNIQALLYLARAWYHKALKDHSYADIRSALRAAKSALALSPKDLAITFNIAMIEQKGVEILFDVPPARRTLADINLAITDGVESLKLFEQLAEDKSEATPYQKELPRQRARYGQNLNRRAADVIKAQEEYEQTEQGRLDRAKQARDLERQRLAEIEREKQEEIRRQAEQLAEQRRVMREEAAKWAESRVEIDSEEEEKRGKREKKDKDKVKKRGKKDEDGAGGDGSGEDEEKPKSKKRKSIKSKAKNAEDGEAADNAMDLDEDGEEAVVAPGRRKPGAGRRVVKSKEYISDSDDESTNEEGS